jgi:hypothetical protein
MLIVVAYVTLTLMFLHQNELVNSILFAMDLYLLIDIVGQMIGYGIKGNGSYFSNDLAIKSCYVISQIICTIFFVATVPAEIEVAIRSTRSFILFGCSA